MESIEITDEMLNHAIACRDCSVCKMKDIRSAGSFRYCGQVLASVLKSERAERAKNPGVWDGAPDNARYATIGWYEDSGRESPLLRNTFYFRTLPKTKAREIAEKKARIWANGSQSIDYQKNLADIIESAILEALADKK